MSAGSRVVVAAAGAVVSVVIARLLGPDGSGGYAAAQTIVLVLSVLTTLGVESGISYYVSSGRWHPWQAWMAAMRVAVVAGAVGIVLGAVARLAFPSAFAGLSFGTSIVAVAALPFWLAFFYTGFVALSIDRYEAFSGPPALQALLTLVLATVGAVFFDVAGAVAGMTLATVIVGLGTAVWAARRLTDARGEPEPGALRRATSFGLRGYLANALQVVNYRVDVFVLSAAVGSAAVGQYAVAVALTGVLWLLPNALADVLFPRIASLAAPEGEATRDMVETKGLRHVVIVIVAVSVVIALALVLLVVPVYGEAFRPAIAVGLILLPGTALIGIANVLASSLMGRGYPQYALYTVICTLPPTLVLYAVLIPAEGARGAALASTLSYAGNFVLTAFFYRRVTGRGVLRGMVPSRDELRDIIALGRRLRGSA